MNLSRQYIREVRLKRESVPSFENYPFSLNAINKLDTLKLHPSVTFFIGENGSGKSTLLEAIAVAWGFNPEGGSRNFNFETQSSHSALYKYLTLVKGTDRPSDGYFLRAESFFNVSTEIDRLDKIQPQSLIDSYGGKSLHEQSHGEAFLSLMLHRFHGHGLYILDEPEAALSPQRQLAVITRINDLVRKGSQFIIATHSPIIMAFPDAHIYSFSPKGISLIDYLETEHFQITHDFLTNRKRSLDILLAPEE